MSTKREKVIDRIRKLFAMSTSSFEQEADAFKSKAHAMLAEHDLTLADVFDGMPGPSTKGRPPRPRDARFSGKFTDAWVKHTKPQPKEVQYAEYLKKGLSLLLYVSPHGKKTWRVLFYRQGKPRGKRIGVYPSLAVADARTEAFKFDPDAAIAAKEAGTFKQAAEEWIEDHVVGQNLRTKPEIERCLNRYIYPEWENTPIFDIDRDDVSTLVRSVVKKHGRPQADAVFSVISRVMSWYRRNGPKAYEAVYPIVPGMKPDKRKSKAKWRTRVLTDDEIRAVWAACAKVDLVYGALVKMLLLTGQRLMKVATMRYSDIEGRIWTIPTDENEKGTAREIKFSDMALTVLKEVPKIEDNDFVFPSGKGSGRHFNSFSQRKEELDLLVLEKLHEIGEQRNDQDLLNQVAKVRKLREQLVKGSEKVKEKAAEELKNTWWRLHDLRRTAKTRMSKIKVDRLHSELALGHTLQGVEGNYDQNDFKNEIAAALQKLANHIAVVLDPPNNVVPLRRRSNRRTTRH